MVIIQEIVSGYHTGIYIGGYVVVIIRRIFNGYHVGIASGYRTGVWVLSWNHNWICIHYVYMSNA